MVIRVGIGSAATHSAGLETLELIRGTARSGAVRRRTGVYTATVVSTSRVKKMVEDAGKSGAEALSIARRFRNLHLPDSASRVVPCHFPILRQHHCKTVASSQLVLSCC